MVLERVVITDLRNIRRAVLEPAARFNVIAGNNGQGKTSILEAIYLLLTTRSFRTSTLAEMVLHDAACGSVRGQVIEQVPGGALHRKQSVGIERGRRVARLDGEPPTTLAHYATRTPVVVFEPRQMIISTGPASERRTLLDRVMLFAEPELAGHRSRYQRAMRERQRLLSDRFPRLEGVAELDAYEALMAEHGVVVTAARRRAVESLARELHHSFAAIAAPDLELSASYQPGGGEDIEEARASLSASRHRDARSRRTRFGPHRDELTLDIDGHPARVVGSQGQHRAITLALKIAELRCIARARGVNPILLLDDVSSELDAERTAAMFRHLARTRGQIFLTTTRPDLIVTLAEHGSDRRDYVVDGGALSTPS